MTTVIFQQIHSETDQVELLFALNKVKCIRWDCVYTSCRTFPAFQRRLLVGPQSVVLGSVRFLFERYQASWISQQKVVESASLLKFRGFPIMRTITASTAFKMPLHGISLLLSASPESSTVFQSSEKLSCANEVGASKPLFINKGLLLTDRSLSGHQLHSFSDFQGVDFLCLEKLYQSNFTAAKSSNGLSRLFFL